jgi:hypothetical protein
VNFTQIQFVFLMTHNLMVLSSLLENHVLPYLPKLVLRQKVPLDVRVRDLSPELEVLCKKFLNLFGDILKVTKLHYSAAFLLPPGRQPLLIIVLVGSFDFRRYSNCALTDDRDVDVLDEETSDVLLLQRTQVD